MEIRNISNSSIALMSDEELLKIAKVLAEFADMISNEIFGRLSKKLESQGWLPISSHMPPTNVRIDCVSAFTGIYSSGVAISEEDGSIVLHSDIQTDAPTHWRLSTISESVVQ